MCSGQYVLYDVSISGPRKRHSFSVHFYVLSCLYFKIYLYLEACEKKYWKKIKYVNICWCLCNTSWGSWLCYQGCMQCCWLFSYHGFYVSAPPLSSSILLSLYTWDSITACWWFLYQMVLNMRTVWQQNVAFEWPWVRLNPYLFQSCCLVTSV